MTPVSVAVVGGGFMARVHARAAGATLAGALASSPERPCACGGRIAREWSTGP